jgi:septum site-determining protein MinD
MFGYIKPQQSDLLVRQYELYRALYCGLCDTITSKVSPALSLSLSYDFVFLDAPAGVEAGFKLAAAYADRCILVTGSGPAALRDAARTAQVLELMGKQNVRLVVNRVQPKLFKAMDVTVDDMMDTAGLPLLGIIPEEPNVTLAATFNCPLLCYKPRCAAAKAGQRIAKRILGIPVPVQVR